ncbi:MAG TPA: spore coat protein [Candidatus Faeciplasma avium]|uniref:Spore coat protein n=1 Tax=Candidatus Faeciplasma avium TaxID=2840798 RepID=A0A9D1NPD5_9FIRM|nr:spore coat protein [Candidatus Faeciplasma avium]
MNLTQKETGLLKDLRDQEKLCVEKYTRYSCDACSTELKELFKEIAKTEQNHYNTVSAMLTGTVPAVTGTPLQNEKNQWCKKVSYADQRSRDIDRFLASDMLSTEKHVSSLYDVSVFEFSDPNARRVLNHIQAEEQQHGESLYAFMSCNGLYGSQG